ncbi:MAG: hypothetical protein IPI78_17115 [Chitinophagaceae bacterium]|nr:hypothetical protein [Chitinophagaceae bacterium]
MDLQFQHKEYFWLLAAVVILFALFLSLLYWKKRVTKRIGDEKLVKALIADYSPKSLL